MTLFAEKDRQRFMAVTGSRYDAMVVRLKRKKMTVPFTKERLRSWYGFHELEGPGHLIECRYCHVIVGVEGTGFDHEIPLSRGGSPGIDNIGFPCAECNARKGEMLPEEYELLLRFLEKRLPYARVNILKRLQEHSKLLAGKRRSEMLVRNNGTAPKKSKKKAPPLFDANF